MSGWKSFNATQIGELSIQLSKHVQDCFAAERIVSTTIDDTTTHSQLMLLDIETEFNAAL